MSLPLKAIPLVGSKNVSTLVEGKVLYLCCDLSRNFGQSTSGRTIIIASSAGNKQVGNSNAFIGLNVFTKSLEKRNLRESALDPLRTDTFHEVGQGLAWRIEEDNVTLVIKIDFDKASERPASSGNSFLIASTSGNKEIAKTGIMCGLNCYRPATATFQVDKIGESASGTALTVGKTVTLKDGFSVCYSAENKVTVFFEGVIGTESLSMPPCVVGENTLALHLAPKQKRARTETSTKQSDKVSTSDVKNEKVTLGGGNVDEKVRNMHVSGTKLEDGAVQLNITFNPTKNFGPSTSGKSLIVSTSSGFQPLVNNGNVLGRIQFNAYRAVPQLDTKAVRDAVYLVLAKKPKSELESLLFKDVLREVREELSVQGAHERSIKDEAKAAVKEFLEEARRQNLK